MLRHAMTKDHDPSTVARAPALRGASSRFEILVNAGPDQGERVEVSARSPGRVLIGTSASATLRLTDRRVSRRHLAFDVDDGRLRVTDLGSTNGTTLNGVRVLDAFCEGGELIAIGDTSLRVDVERQNVETPDVRMAFGSVIGASLAMRRLYRTFDALALSQKPLLIEGEPGTGKVTLADALHASRGESSSSPQQRDDSGRPFVLVEGASLAAETLAADGPALVEEARGGTLVIRGLGEVPRDAQPALASLIARAESEARVVATTHHNLDALVEAGAFAEELLLVMSTRVELPPLRQRRGDIGLLVEHFARRFGTTSATLPPKKLAALNRHEFPENVRGLERAVARLLADASAPLIDGAGTARPMTLSPEALGLDVQYRDLITSSLPFAEAKEQLLERFAGAYVAFAVAAHGGHVARAAAASGLAPRYFNILRARSRR